MTGGVCVAGPTAAKRRMVYTPLSRGPHVLPRCRCAAHVALMCRPDVPPMWPTCAVLMCRPCGPHVLPMYRLCAVAAVDSYRSSDRTQYTLGMRYRGLP